MMAPVTQLGEKMITWNKAWIIQEYAQDMHVVVASQNMCRHAVVCDVLMKKKEEAFLYVQDT